MLVFPHRRENYALRRRLVYWENEAKRARKEKQEALDAQNVKMGKKNRFSHKHKKIFLFSFLIRKKKKKRRK